VAQILAVSGRPQSNKNSIKSERFVAIITAPVLRNDGGQVDHGFFFRDYWDRQKNDAP